MEDRPPTFEDVCRLCAFDVQFASGLTLLTFAFLLIQGLRTGHWSGFLDLELQGQDGVFVSLVGLAACATGILAGCPGRKGSLPALLVLALVSWGNAGVAIWALSRGAGDLWGLVLWGQAAVVSGATLFARILILMRDRK